MQTSINTQPSSLVMWIWSSGFYLEIFFWKNGKEEFWDKLLIWESERVISDLIIPKAVNKALRKGEGTPLTKTHFLFQAFSTWSFLKYLPLKSFASKAIHCSPHELSNKRSQWRG